MRCRKKSHEPHRSLHRQLPSFEKFRQRMAALSDKDKDDILERLTQVYLQITPEYRATAEARDVVAGIVAKRVQKEYGIKHTLVFAKSIRASKGFPPSALNGWKRRKA